MPRARDRDGSSSLFERRIRPRSTAPPSRVAQPAAGWRGGKLFTGDHAGGESSALTTSIEGGGGGEASVGSAGAGAAAGGSSADAEFSASLIAQFQVGKEESSQRERTL